MALNFRNRGLPKEEAEAVVEKLAQNEQFFVNFVVSEGMGVSVTEESESEGSLLSDVFVMFLSYVVFGSLPVLVFFLGLIIDPSIEEAQLYIIALILSILVIFTLGALKCLLAECNWVVSAAEVAIMALFVALLSCTTTYYSLGLLSMK